MKVYNFLTEVYRPENCQKTAENQEIKKKKHLAQVGTTGQCALEGLRFSQRPIVLEYFFSFIFRIKADKLCIIRKKNVQPRNRMMN